MKNLILCLMAVLAFTINSTAQESKKAIKSTSKTVVKKNGNVTVKKTTTVKTDLKKSTTKSNVVLKKDGTPDKRYKSSKTLKKDGTPDMRYKENKNTTTTTKK